MRKVVGYLLVLAHKNVIVVLPIVELLHSWTYASKDLSNSPLILESKGVSLIGIMFWSTYIFVIYVCYYQFPS